VFVEMLSDFSEADANYITEKTTFYRLVSKTLWKVLGNKRHGQLYLEAVRLLTRCHSVCPNTWCEDVILEELLSNNKRVRIPAVERFCRMWHLIRTCRSYKLAGNGC